MAAPPRHFHARHYEGIADGPFKSLNPTARRFPLAQKPVAAADDTRQAQGQAPLKEVRADDVQQQWRSRDNRKGRHMIVVTPEADQNAQFLTPPSTSTPREIARGLWRMVSYYPYWDVSYLVATIFTFGSVVWVVNAFFAWLPLQKPSTEFHNEGLYGGGITAFIGATIFEVGSVLLMIEAVNENTSECFGWALEEVLEENGLVRVRPGECSHHHRNRGNLVGKGEGKGDEDALPFTFIPTLSALRTHYLHELGFLACLSQLLGASIFWIAGLTALPPIYTRLSIPAANGIYWLPQVIGGSGFIVSGVLFMLETQKKWYIPAPKVLGWHIAVWNLIGGIGFTLCGALGFASANSGALYQASLATYWGSWCFLIGSAIQWYESLDKHPVAVTPQSSASLSNPSLSKA